MFQKSDKSMKGKICLIFLKLVLLTWPSPYFSMFPFQAEIVTKVWKQPDIFLFRNVQPRRVMGRGHLWLWETGPQYLFLPALVILASCKELPTQSFLSPHGQKCVQTLYETFNLDTMPVLVHKPLSTVPTFKRKRKRFLHPFGSKI